ncbi:PH-like domain-containing protein [Protaetiibacter mangrovi]|uniref:PH domain-containing protein n=1 Tax=Protaetiibacter mangrovi TaxID=2970926 RepID=A0ABT1ZBY5_9MICO|nr:hypothetical protein [Protaetiibacter mangrovi]MCS0498198.1 hypothetical protein [Protaetiibacter mangrovi]TPX04654.1 hypothetical protein FJ656_10730 [Schumannella luteola]
MDERLIPALVVGAMLVVALVFMALGWRNRRRSQSALDVVPVPPDEIGEPLATERVLYVATTLAEQPLERVVVEGLAFRARGEVRIARGGAVLDLAGARPAFIPVADIRGVGLASWTIDKGVEEGGLVFVRWELGGTAVDTYLRSERSEQLLDRLTELSPTAAAASRADRTDSTPDGEASA